ncbi:MAG: YceI family protein [Bacteroidales bacterium]
METSLITTKTNWLFDQAHSEIGFKIRHLMISNVKGTFNTFDANIMTDLKDFTTATIDLWIDASSIDTGNETRDQHLKSGDFLNVENHKQILFKSNSIGLPDKDGNHEMLGELSMLGITQKVKLNVEFGGVIKDPWGNEKAGFTVTGKINRKDWGLFWNTPLETGGIMVGDDVSILCEVELINAG